MPFKVAALAIANVIPDENRAVADKRTAEMVYLELAFDESSEDNNLRPRMKHFCLKINLTCPNMKSY